MNMLVRCFSTVTYESFVRISNFRLSGIFKINLNGISFSTRKQLGQVFPPSWSDSSSDGVLPWKLMYAILDSSLNLGPPGISILTTS